MSKQRIAILGMHLESNAFAPVTTGVDFRASCYLVEDEIVAEALFAHPQESRSRSSPIPNISHATRHARIRDRTPSAPRVPPNGAWRRCALL